MEFHLPVKGKGIMMMMMMMMQILSLELVPAAKLANPS
jgi:hypothetical protein